MKKRFLALLLALSAALLCSCANTEEHTSETTDGVKRLINPTVTISNGTDEIEPYLWVISSNLPESDIPERPESFTAIKYGLPEIICTSEYDISFFINGEKQKLVIERIDENGYSTDYGGGGTYYARTSFTYKNTTILKNGEPFEEVTFYRIYFKIKFVPVEAKINYSEKEAFRVSKQSDFEKKIPGYYYNNYTMFFAYPSVSTRTISGDLAKRFEEKLFSLEKTGNIITSFSEEVTDIRDYSLVENLDPQLIWFDVGDKIYRISPSLKTLCLVNNYFGEGEELSADAEFWDMLPTVNSWFPHIDSYYEAVFSEDTVNIAHIYESAPSIEMKLTSLTVGKKLLRGENNSHAEIQLTALEDVSFAFNTALYLSDDVLGPSYSENIELKKGETKNVTVEFVSEVPFSFIMEISAGTTKMSITFML